MSLAGSLKGVRVLDLTRLLPGPFLTMVLADLGADVVKVEDPRLGDYLRALPPARNGLGGRFLAINRGKRSCTLDLKSEAGRAAFLRMCERADVVVESFRPGVLDRLGLGYDTLKGKNAGLILCSISGYGQTGPYRDRAGHDVNYVGLTGVLAMTGEGGRTPIIPGLQIADFCGGAMWGLSGILAALFRRERQGGGSHLDISMTEGVLAFVASELGQLWAGGAATTRGQGTLNGGNANYAIYQTADQRFLSVGALEPKFWDAFNQAIGRQGSANEITRAPAEQAALHKDIQAIIGRETLDTWQKRFAAFDCCVEPILELDEVPDHAQHIARGMFFLTKDRAGHPLRQLRTPLGQPADPSPPPTLGEHTREVLLEYGFSSAEATSLSD